MSTQIGNITYLNEDILSHIDGPETLAGQVATSEACISMFKVIKVCASVQNDEVKIVVKLSGVVIGQAMLSLKKPSVQIRGHILGFKAEVVITLKTTPWILSICATLCAPIAGCKKGCTTVNL